MLDQLFDALNVINWNKGKGDIVSIVVEQSRHHDQPHRGIVHRKMTSSTDSRSFTVVGNTVKFLGRRRKLKTPA